MISGHHFNPVLERKLAGLRLDYVLELAYDVISCVTPANSIVHSKTLKRSKKLIHNSLRNSSLTRYD